MNFTASERDVLQARDFLVREVAAARASIGIAVFSGMIASTLSRGPVRTLDVLWVVQRFEERLSARKHPR